jgi:predicted metal-dependent peptidase
MKQINPYEFFPSTHKVTIAMRTVSRKWFLCYSKLLAFEWWITDDPSIPYGATDGRRLILNESGIRKLESEPDAVNMIAFLLCHEALHGLLGHGWRVSKLKCKQTANVAADYIINAMISDHGMTLMPNVLLNKQLSGTKSMEALYYELLRDGQPPALPMPDLVELEIKPDENKQEVIDKLESQSEAMFVADKACAKTNGVTATLVTDRGSVADIRWQDMLWGFFTQHPRSRWCSPMNRPVFSSSGLVCLGREKRPRGSLAVVVDTSGSVSKQMLSDFLSEVNDIIKQVRPAETHLLSVSHKVADYFMLDDGELTPPTMKGGGGTLFQPAFDFLEERMIEPDVLVYLTDGYSGDATTLKPIKYPVLWLSTGAVNMNQGDVIPVK